MLVRRWRSATGVAVAAALLGGCVPSDPERPPMGLRLDNGVLSVLVPECASSDPISAEVRPVSGSTFPPAIWESSGFRGDVTKGIALSSDDWSSVSGSYVSVYPFDVTVRLRGRALGAAYENRPLSDLEGLAPDTYRVDGVVTTSATYLAQVAKKFPCPR